MAGKKLLKPPPTPEIKIPEYEFDENVIGPTSLKQEMFLTTKAKITVFGGSLCSGKSTMGLMKHLLYVNDPNYRGYVIRKQQTTIMKTGGLFESARDLYLRYDPRVKVNKKHMTFTFPSGAVVGMGHCETDEDAEKWRGPEFQGAMIDEGNQLQERHVDRIFSRLRTTKADMVPNMWLTCNPDPDSFVFQWIQWWLYPKGHEFEGRPDPAKCGVLRYYIRQNNVMVWGDSVEEMLEKYGTKDEAGNFYPQDDLRQLCKPISMTFIGATILDNPIAIKKNPEYLATLMGLPRVERERDFEGNWLVRADKSTFFQREWIKEAHQDPPHTEIVRTVRAYDFAGTLKSETDNSPDYTACVKMSKLKDGSYFVHDVQRIRIRFGDWEDFILRNAHKDGKNTTIVLPVDPSIASKEAVKLTRIRLIENGFQVSTRRATQNKVDRFRIFSSLAQNGDVSFRENCGTDYENNIFNSLDFVYSELENFDGRRHNSERFHDDKLICRL